LVVRLITVGFSVPGLNYPMVRLIAKS